MKLYLLGGGVNSAVGQAHVSAIGQASGFSLGGGFFSRDETIQKDSLVSYRVTRESPATDESFGVVILTPPDSRLDVVDQHYELLERAELIIWEKPLSVSCVEACKISELFGQKSFSVFNYLGYPAVWALRKEINDGLIGNILSVNVEMLQDGFVKLASNGERLRPQVWRRRDGAISTVSLDLGVHVLSLLNFVTGISALEVKSAILTRALEMPIKDSCRSLCESSGVPLQLAWGKNFAGRKNAFNIEVFGERGAMAWHQENPDVVEFSDQFGVVRYCQDGDPPLGSWGHYGEARRFKVGHPVGFIDALTNYYNLIANFLGHLGVHPGSNEIESFFELDEAIRCIKLLAQIEAAAC